HPFWQESWYYDWSSADGDVAGFSRMGYYPNLGEVWFWLYLFAGGRVIAIRDHSIPLAGRWGKTEHRAGGLWFDYRAQEPLRAWSLQVEAVGIAVDSPRDLRAAEVGDPVAVGLDISFEAMAPPY